MDSHDVSTTLVLPGPVSGISLPPMWQTRGDNVWEPKKHIRITRWVQKTTTKREEDYIFFKPSLKKTHNVSLLFHVFCFNAKFLATKKKLVVPSFNQHGHGKSVFTPSAWRVAKGGETFALQHLKNYMESLGNAEIWMDFVEKWPSKTRKSYHQQKGSRMVSSNPSFFKGCCC